ncbi:ATP-binding protein [Sphingomonas sabuli]|uniref:histidine kinase n=1 Tax=Sphingomonas sabuli TaxID=2764186 RepID=A0A7G9L2F8_9SPHN|nr:ATP-binding protein [Sphingomonas sabuli]QNM82807.1 ATP-binding protein [Sphingomonas sabuli]
MTTLDQASRALLEAIDDPAMIIDRGIIRAANKHARTLLGPSIQGSDVRLAIRQPQALEFVHAGNPGDIDFTGVGAVGRPWRLTLRSLGGAGALITLIDRSAAHAAEKMRVDFVANASHELRTPLTAILGYAESLEDGGLDPATTSSFAATIRGEAKRMLRIIEDLMSLSRIEAGRFVAPTDSVSIASVVSGAVERVREISRKRGCTVETTLEDGLAPTRGDLPQITQVVDNLLQNAVRYGCASPDCRIRLAAYREGRWIRLDVSDTGPGIPREHLPFVTRRFYRVDAARSRDTGGTGLGLAIVKHIVERHRGELAIASDPGAGTTVTIRLPASD